MEGFLSVRTFFCRLYFRLSFYSMLLFLIGIEKEGKGAINGDKTMHGVPFHPLINLNSVYFQIALHCIQINSIIHYKHQTNILKEFA